MITVFSDHVSTTRSGHHRFRVNTRVSQCLTEERTYCLSTLSLNIRSSIIFRLSGASRISPYRPQIGSIMVVYGCSVSVYDILDLMGRVDL